MVGKLLNQFRSRVLLKLGLALALAVAVGAAGHGAYRYTVSRAELISGLEHQAHLMGRDLARYLAAPLLENDQAALSGLIGAFGAGKELQGLVVRGTDGQPRFSIGDVALDPKKAIVASQEITHIGRDGVSTPVGSLTLGLPRSSIERALRQEMAEVAVIHFSLASIILLFTLVWLRRVGKPAGDIVAALEKLAGEDTDIHLSGLRRGDELGRLSLLVWKCRNALLRRRRAEGEARALVAEQGAFPDRPRDGIPPRRGSRPTSSTEAGTVSQETVPFELDGMMGGLVTLPAARAEEKGLELVLDSGLGAIPPLLGDPLCLGQVLTNLIGNAIKFSRQGTIAVSAREKSREGGSVELHFSVQDQGGGLTPAQQARLFQIFTQSGTFNPSRPAGNGLGLAICKRLVENMGGTIWVESQYGMGSTFHFTARFTLGPPSSKAVRPYAERLKAFAARRVMVVDDNGASREAAGKLLATLGFVPDLFSSGREALASLDRGGPGDYAFCCIDRVMPDLDGLQVARQLQVHYGRNCPPLLLLTASSQARELHSVGREFAAAISKPFTLGQFFNQVIAVLKVPAAGNPPRRYPGDRVVASGLKGKRVLLVEHAELNREVMADFLLEAEVRVRVAANGLEALQAVREEVPDCVLMDCRMPVMDGYEAAARLRALGYEHLPIIALTMNAAPGERESCLAAGMSDFLNKPVDFPSLLSTLAKWLVTPGLESAEQPVSSPGFAELEIPVAEREPLPPLPPGLDVESGLRRLRGKTGLFLKALRLFRDSRGHQFQVQFRAAVAAEDWQTSERLAHSLAATAATIGANEVSAAAASLEDAIRAGNYWAVQPLLAKVTGKLQALVDGLARIG